MKNVGAAGDLSPTTRTSRRMTGARVGLKHVSHDRRAPEIIRDLVASANYGNTVRALDDHCVRAPAARGTSFR